MNSAICERCGGDEFKIENGYKICKYCKSKYPMTSAERATNSSIELNEDVQRLLRLCEENPDRASQYAGLILDIDPTNREALKYLRRR